HQRHRSLLLSIRATFAKLRCLRERQVATDKERTMRSLPVILFGVGGVGRALLRQIVEQRSFHALQYGLRLELLAVCDSDGALVEPTDGLDDELIYEVIAAKEAGQRLAQHPAGGIQNDLSGIVDIAGRADTV